MTAAHPFDHFTGQSVPRGPLRAAIDAACRRPERDCLRPLIEAARLAPIMRDSVRGTARVLIEALRAKPHGSVVEELVQEYALSSQEGVALMCLAEALLRIPDVATRDALIRDKIADGDWMSHIGGGRSLFVNAATWGLVVTGKLTGTVSASGLGSALTRLIARAGEPVIRRGVDLAIRMMGEQFVTGEAIGEALARAEEAEARGYRFSYDMLGEAAMTAADAARYFAAYETAIHAIGRAAKARGVYGGPGISIKLSALHPRYSRAQAERIRAELLPCVAALARLARGYDIGLNIDAEEADRLDLSLDILESLSLDPALSGWNGLGFVVQAYGRRCPFVLDFIIDLARRSGRRIMVRLVKGAYWDAEIKRAQVDGLADFPVFTRKVHTDVSYIACARKLLDNRDAVFPQFATHNAQTLATIFHLAGPDFSTGDYEFQCLHGMGEPLYDEVVGAGGLNRPCRIYAPVGTHETLLAYLVRRLLENGANSSFVNRIADPDVPVDDLIADPVETALAMPDPGAPHDRIALPSAIYGARVNSSGIDLASESALARLSDGLRESASMVWQARPTEGDGDARPIRNPGDHDDVVGVVIEARQDEVAAAVAMAMRAAPRWAAEPVSSRAACLRRAAGFMQERMPVLMGLIMRETGKSAPNAIAEVREAIDFLRYYADEAEAVLTHGGAALGPVACISPWNFPLAIFTGQVAAALVAGNPVLAKPAEETPLIAAEAVRLLHAAGIPADVLHLLPGDGRVGAALTAASEVAGVMFTGSTEVARLINRTLSRRLSREGRPVPLIAETGGQNAMIVDSSALAEQVVGDVIASAFDSAGQRCSALRLLCLQEDIAERTLAMLRGALAELSIGRTDRLSVDIGPVIAAEAQAAIEAHVAAMRGAGCRVERLDLPAETGQGTFVAPTIIEIDSIAQLGREVFGPVLHVLRYRRDDLDRVIDAINATGYGLTFGLHTRIDETIAHVTERVGAGNIYINRNIIGAVVGVQPFGGRGLSGTGPKAGGPLYLRRLVAAAPEDYRFRTGVMNDAIAAYALWLARKGFADEEAFLDRAAAASPLGFATELAGPVGEQNRYSLHPRGTVLLAPMTVPGALRQIACMLVTGNRGVVLADDIVRAALADLPPSVQAVLTLADRLPSDVALAHALVEGDAAAVLRMADGLATRDGAIVTMQAVTAEGLSSGGEAYSLPLLVEEVSVSVNTTAAGGNASLMTIG